jgi:hypothetical protein
MATWGDLILAILSLDAYNRGYGPGMIFPNNSDLAGTKIGGAEILDTFGDPNTSFYAIAYRWGDKTVISYRGTSFEGGPDIGDVLNGITVTPYQLHN